MIILYAFIILNVIATAYFYYNMTKNMRKVNELIKENNELMTLRVKSAVENQIYVGEIHDKVVLGK